MASNRSVRERSRGGGCSALDLILDALRSSAPRTPRNAPIDVASHASRASKNAIRDVEAVEET
jgi:hypothetical protein